MPIVGYGMFYKTTKFYENGLLNTSDTHKEEVNPQQYILLHYLQQSANIGVIFRFRASRNRVVFILRCR